MSKKVFYRYNPETDNYERVFPSWRERAGRLALFLGAAAVLGFLLFLLAYYGFSTPTENHLREENAKLKSQYDMLSTRLENALEVMAQIQDRDDNFYRALLQMEPMSTRSSYTASRREQRFNQLGKMSDADLASSLNRRMDLLEKSLYAQSLSFDEMREHSADRRVRLRHIPAILPVYTGIQALSSGYGTRTDPFYNQPAFHPGVDFALPAGTPVYATADGTVKAASWVGGYGICIDLDHGYDYTTRYAHLNSVEVEEGQPVRRGQKIGEVGSTGKSTQPHLHYEVRFKGEAQDPVNYYFMDLNPEQYEAIVNKAANAGRVLD